jgi:hypothetical protein
MVRENETRRYRDQTDRGDNANRDGCRPLLTFVREAAVCSQISPGVRFETRQKFGVLLQDGGRRVTSHVFRGAG